MRTSEAFFGQRSPSIPNASSFVGEDDDRISRDNSCRYISSRAFIRVQSHCDLKLPLCHLIRDLTQLRQTSKTQYRSSFTMPPYSTACSFLAPVWGNFRDIDYVLLGTTSVAPTTGIRFGLLPRLMPSPESSAAWAFSAASLVEENRPR